MDMTGALYTENELREMIRATTTGRARSKAGFARGIIWDAKLTGDELILTSAMNRNYQIFFAIFPVIVALLIVFNAYRASPNGCLLEMCGNPGATLTTAIIIYLATAWGCSIMFKMQHMKMRELIAEKTGRGLAD